MAKFCTNCGKELKDGEVCDCKKNKKEEEKVVAVPVETNGGNASDMFNAIVSDVKGLFVKPVDTMKDNCDDKKFVKGIILNVILAVAGGLFVLALIDSLMSSLTLFGGYGSIMDGGYYTADYDAFEVFIKSAGFLFALTFVYSGLLYLVNTVIFKGKGTFKEIYSVFAVSSIVETCGFLLSALLVKIDVTEWAICFWPLLAGSVLSTVYKYHMIKFVGPKDENKHGYIYLLSYALYIAAIVIILKVLN